MTPVEYIIVGLTFVFLLCSVAILVWWREQDRKKLMDLEKKCNVLVVALSRHEIFNDNLTAKIKEFENMKRRSTR